MTISNKDATSLWEITTAIERIQGFTASMSYDDYIANDLVQSAVERKFEIIGEAVRRLSDEFKQVHPDIDWRKLVGLRNIIAHRYDQIDHAILWDAIESFLPNLLEQIKIILPPVSDID
jgi:uncharacterized protein with HEPN domain